MLPNTAELRKTYQAFSDRKLIELAGSETDSLRPEALAVLKEVLAERQLMEAFNAIEVQIAPIDSDKFSEYCDMMQQLPCPYCKSSAQKLNATITGAVKGYVIFTTYEKELKIACPTCLDKLNSTATTATLLSGWLGFPFSLINMAKAVILNNKMKKNNHTPTPNNLFQDFVYQNRGKIELHKNNPGELKELIQKLM